MFLKISHNLQDNACTRASFSTKGPSVYSFIKKKLRYRYIFVNFAIFLNTTFLQNTYKWVPGGQLKEENWFTSSQYQKSDSSFTWLSK